MQKSGKTPLSSIVRYGLLALPLSFAGIPIYLHIPDLYATQFGVPLATIGVLLLIVRLFDAFQDPLIGHLCKNLKDKKQLLGRIVFLFVFIMAAGIYLLLHPQDTMPTYLWFIIFMMVCTTSFSVLSIVYQSIGAVWKEDYHERTRITTTREAIGLIGIAFAAVLPSVLMQFYEPQKAFEIFAYIFASLIFLVTIFWLRWLQGAEFETLQKKETGKKISLRKNKAIRPLFAVWFISQLSSAIPVVLVIFFIRDHLQLEHLTGLFLLMYFLSGVLGMPIWQQIEKLFGKQKTWQIAMLLAVFSFIWAFFLQSGDAVGYAFVCIFSGLALGAELAIPPSILADKISQQKAGGQSTKFFGVSTFLGKFALALASGLILPAIAYWGYTPGSENSATAIGALIIGYTLLPCLLKLAVAISLSFIKLEGDKNDNRNKI